MKHTALLTALLTRGTLVNSLGQARELLTGATGNRQPATGSEMASLSSLQ